MTYEIQLKQKLEAPAKEDTPVGCVRFYLNGEPAAEIPVYAGSAVEKWDLKTLFWLLIKHFLLG